MRVRAHTRVLERPWGSKRSRWASYHVPSHLHANTLYMYQAEAAAHHLHSCGKGCTEYDDDYSDDSTVSPSVPPTAKPTMEPSTEPSAEPTTAPTVSPTTAPSISPTTEPSVAPTSSPTQSADSIVEEPAARVAPQKATPHQKNQDGENTVPPPPPDDVDPTDVPPPSDIPPTAEPTVAPTAATPVVYGAKGEYDDDQLYGLICAEFDDDAVYPNCKFVGPLFGNVRVLVPII